MRRLKTDIIWLYLIQMVFGYIWLTAGFGKFQEDFKAELPQTLNFFASKNPYSWMKSFLLDFALPNVNFFSQLIPWAQLIAGLILVFGTLILIFVRQSFLRRFLNWLVVLALLAAIFQNFTYYFAAGWTSPSTSSINLLMFLMGIIFLIFTIWGAKKPATI